MLSDRKKQLLEAIIQEYIRAAEPVGSTAIAKMPQFKVSSATVRNELHDLEKEGYLFQPHTSAGRLPTEKAWKFYLETGLKAKALATTSTKQLDQALKRGLDATHSIKEMSKELAEVSQQTVIFSFRPNDNFYTGISNLFKQPEFADHTVIYELSEVIDHLDDVVAELHEMIGNDVETFIGKNNPFGIHTGFTVAKSNKGMLGILGPVRQDYSLNQALLNYSHQLVTKL